MAIGQNIEKVMYFVWYCVSSFSAKTHSSFLKVLEKVREKRHGLVSENSDMRKCISPTDELQKGRKWRFILSSLKSLHRKDDAAAVNSR